MKPLEQAVSDYLHIRRSCGYQLQGVEGLLGRFVAFLQAEGAPYITSELALRWSTQPAKAQPFRWAQRLCGFNQQPTRKLVAFLTDRTQSLIST